MKKLIAISAALVLVFAFTVPAMAEWNFYGHSRFETYWVDQDEEFTGDTYGDSDLKFVQQGNSRIGANVKFNDSVSGRFEYGTGVNLRLLYGDWNFGAGTLRVGQSYTPITHFNSNMAFGDDDGMFSCGEAYAGRQDLIQVSFGGFKLAFIDPNNETDAFNSSDTDVTLPKIEFNYGLNLDAMNFDIYGGYQTYERVNATDDGYDVDSYIIGGQGKFTFGPMWFVANVWYAQNPDEYGIGGHDTLSATWTGSDYEDTETLAGQVVVAFKASDMLSFEGGVGYAKSELDLSGVDYEDTMMLYYVQCAIKLAQNVTMKPEFGLFDYDESEVGGTTTDDGSQWYLGTQWRIDF